MTPPCGHEACAVPAIEASLDEIKFKLDRLLSAFPETPKGDVDVDGHRRYHEAATEAAQAQKEFWAQLKLDLAKKGAWGLLILLLGLLLAGLSSKMGVIR